MSNRHISRALGKQQIGNIEEFLKTYSIIKATNDGENHYAIKEIIPITKLPMSDGDEIEIRLTDSDLDVIQFHDSFFTMNIKTTLNFSHELYDSLQQDIQESAKKLIDTQYLMIGWKSGSQAIGEYTVTHKGVTVDSTRQNSATYEAYLNNLYKPRSEKNNRKHIHTLYDSVEKFDTSICGAYVKISDIKANTPITINIPLSIPFDDILCFTGFVDYPNKLFGELVFKFRINMRSLVYARVNPHKSMIFEVGKKRERYDAIGGQNYSDIMKMVLQQPNSQLEYDRMFTQIGDSSRQFKWKYNINEASESPKTVDGFISDDVITNFVPTVLSAETVRCSATICGYRVTREALARLHDYFTSKPFVIPSQRVETKTFQTAATPSGFQQCQTNIPLNHVTNLVLLFPKNSRQITCFENPMLNNLQLSVGNRNFPEKPLNTMDQQFFQMMLNASDLDALFECTDEYEDSLTVPRADGESIHIPQTDLTSFAITLQAERSGGPGVYFDGLHSNGENRAIELRGAPIYSGETDTYYNVRKRLVDAPTRPPAPLLCTVQDCFWIFSTKNGGECHYIKDHTAEEVLTGMGYM